MNRSISILVAIVFFLFGAGALYVLASQGIVVVNPQVSPSPTVIAAPPVQPTPDGTVDPLASPTVLASPDVNLKTLIQGTLGYPSEGIPPLDVFAININDSSKNASIVTAQNAGSFSIEVEPGTYTVFAYPVGNTQLAGGWTKAVPCGLTIECTDHSLIPVVVVQGKTTTGVEVKDWYAPTGSFPAKP